LFLNNGGNSSPKRGGNEADEQQGASGERHSSAESLRRQTLVGVTGLQQDDFHVPDSGW
jgi:hypothetical protein